VGLPSSSVVAAISDFESPFCIIVPNFAGGGEDRSYRCGNIAIFAVVCSGKMSEFIRHWGDVSLLRTSSCVGVMCRAESGGRARCLLRRNADRPVVVSCATHTPVVALYVP